MTNGQLVILLSIVIAPDALYHPFDLRQEPQVTLATTNTLS